MRSARILRGFAAADPDGIASVHKATSPRTRCSSWQNAGLGCIWTPKSSREHGQATPPRRCSGTRLRVGLHHACTLCGAVQTDGTQGRPLRRPGRLRRALAAAERAPRQLRRPGRQEQHLHVPASRYLGPAAMFSAQTRTQPPSDTIDRIQRAAPLSDRETPRIEGRLTFDFPTGKNCTWKMSKK